MMTSLEFLYRQNEFAVILTAFVLFLIATEIGFRQGRAIAPGLADQSRSQLSTLQTAMVGLMALLLAFSFAMAESRFEARQRLVVDEANAIRTAYLRSQMLPEPYQSEVIKLFRAYVDARLAYFQAGVDPSTLQEAVNTTESVEQKLWSQTVAAAGKDPRSIPIGLFIGALNNVIGLHAERDAARRNHVPEIVLYLLFLVAVVSTGLVGFGCGVGNRRHLPITVSVASLIALVILVIMDLDRPRRGFIEVNQESMINLRNSLR
jgi:hypothetical protein